MREFPETGCVFTRVAKRVGDKMPYPLYKMPYQFRGIKRTLKYALYTDEGKVLVDFWLTCLDKYEARPDLEFCLCCPDFSAGEHMVAVAAIVADAVVPGEPVQEWWPAQGPCV